MTIRMGDIYQDSFGVCYKITSWPERLLELGTFADMIIYKEGTKHKVSLDVNTLEGYRLIYRAPIKHPINLKDQEFFLELHRQIKCL